MIRINSLIAAVSATATLTLSGGWYLQGKPLADRVTDLEERLMELELRLEPKRDVDWTPSLAGALAADMRKLMQGELSPAAIYKKHGGRLPEEYMRASKALGHGTNLAHNARISFAAGNNILGSLQCNRAMNIYNECANLVEIPAFDPSPRK